jgi:hypothetical protein
MRWVEEIVEGLRDKDAWYAQKNTLLPREPCISDRLCDLDASGPILWQVCEGHREYGAFRAFDALQSKGRRHIIGIGAGVNADLEQRRCRAGGQIDDWMTDLMPPARGPETTNAL